MPLAARLGDLRLGAAERAGLARPGIAADQHGTALVGRIERPGSFTSRPALEGFDALRTSVTCQPKCQIALCG